MAEKFFIIDGYGFLFRAYHSLPPLSNSAGQPAGAIYGFTNMMIKLLEDLSPDSIAVALDAGKKTFRNELYSEYKAHRPDPPADLIPQFSMLRDAINAFGIKALEKVGYEADDIIATMVAKALAEGREAVVVSSDKDLMQLLQYQGVHCYDPMKRQYITEQYVVEKYGVKPSQLLDFLAILGDASDNVPGAKGIGLKTAAALLNEFGDLDNIYRNLSSLKPRQQQLFTEAKDLVYLSKKLISLDNKVDIPVDFAALSGHDLRGQAMHQFIRQMGFKSLYKRLGVTATAAPPSLFGEGEGKATDKNKDKGAASDAVPTALAPAAPALLSLREIELEKLDFLSSRAFEKRVQKEGKIVICETEAYIEIVDGAEALMIKTKQAQDLLSQAPQKAEVYKALAPILADESVLKIIIEGKKLYKYLREIDIEMVNFDDINVMSYVLNAGEFKHFGPSVLARRFGSEVGAEDDSSYQLRALHLWQVYQELYYELYQAQVFDLYYNIDRPLQAVVADIERKGVLIDAKKLQSLTQEFSRKLEVLSAKIYELAGKEFNIASPKQLGAILFDEMGLQGGKKSSKTGSLSTSHAVLEKLAEDGHEIAEHILEWRQYTKLITTYTESLPRFIDPKDLRVHTNFMLCATSTGRFSSQDPNLQNIPIRSTAGARVREAFIAAPGNVIISADYSQIEIRLLAHMANIESLRVALREGVDLHALTASQVFGIELDAVSKEQRRSAKAINFGIIYGISAHGLAKSLDIERSEAAEYIKLYLARYPGIKQYMDEMIAYSRRHGYVKTIYGRRCHFPEINSKNAAIRANAERASINAPLQGSAADIIRKDIVKLSSRLKSALVLQIHDELLFEVPSAEAESYSAEIRRVMEKSKNLSVPITVDISSGASWAEAK